MNEPKDWQTLYAAAMLESDTRVAPQRIEKADAAIRARLRELPESISLNSEQAQLQSALGYLSRVKPA